jgi:hypothetical protein
MHSLEWEDLAGLVALGHLQERQQEWPGQQ